MPLMYDNPGMEMKVRVLVSVATIEKQTIVQ